MYYVYIDGELAFDHLSDDSVVSSASLSQKANAAAYLDMSLVPSARPGEGQAVEVRWDGDALFHGRVTDATQGVDGTWDVSCVSDEDRLNGVLVPPHSSDGSVGERCPATVAGYVQWLAEEFNRRCVGGWRVDVGANEGDLLSQGGALSVSDDSWPTVAAALEDRVLSLGGWLDWEPRDGGGTLSVYADVREAAGQVVDMGENVADVKVTRTTDGQRTALVAHSGGITLDGLSDDELALASNAGMMVENGAVYDPEAVARYGYSEAREELQASTRADLVRAAIARLRTLRAPRVTVEARAVDTSVYREGSAHLRPGQAVRARALPLGLDEYLAVQSVDLDLMDPGQTRYTLGVAYDTLTGQQSARLRELNLGIDHSLDLASGAADAAQSARDAAQSAHDAAQSAQDAADAAQGAASSASANASTALSTANSAKTAAEGAADAATNAAKTATNYLGLSSAGLVVGDMTKGALGKNVLIDADSMDVRDGTTVLASFGEDRIDLGKSSQGAIISLCGGQIELRYSEGSGLVLSQGLYSTGAMSCTQLSCRGALNATGPLYLGDGQRAALRGVYAGTVVVTLSGGHAALLTKSQFTAIVGREPRMTDVVLAANGDRAAYIGEPLGCAYNDSSGTWYVGVPNSVSGSFRANYLIIATV